MHLFHLKTSDNLGGFWSKSLQMHRQDSLSKSNNSTYIWANLSDQSDIATNWGSTVNFKKKRVIYMLSKDLVNLLNRTDKHSGSLRLEKLCEIVMSVFDTIDVVTHSIICIFKINVHFSHYIVFMYLCICTWGLKSK